MSSTIRFVLGVVGLAAAFAGFRAEPQAAVATGFGGAVLVGEGEVFVGEATNLFRPGQVYVYRKGSSGWAEAAKLSKPDPVVGDLFGSSLTLDGSRYLGEGELEAIRWLQNAPRGVVAEAIGGSYTGYARVSTHSGMPTVLGWPGHESQWRGGAVEMGTRQPDIIALYRARSLDSALGMIAKYNIRYIYVGPLERGEYRPDEDLFERSFKPVFRNELVTIYEVSRSDSLGQSIQP